MVSSTSERNTHGFCRSLCGDTWSVEEPNSGSVVLNGIDQYMQAGLSVMPDSKTFTVIVMEYPLTSHIGTMFQSSFLHTSGKVSSRRYPLWIHSRSSDDSFRVQCSSGKGSNNLRLTSTFIRDLNEFNISAFSANMNTQVYQQLHWSDTSGISSGTLAADIDGGEDVNFSDGTTITCGATVPTVGVFRDFYNGRIAQVYLSMTVFDLTDPDVQEKIITASEYLNFEGLGVGVVEHSGNTSTFTVNSAANKVYDALSLIGSPTDGAGPTPPFTL